MGVNWTVAAPVAALLLAAPAGVVAEDPVIGGTPLSGWKKLPSDPKKETRLEAARRLGGFARSAGPAAPLLMELLPGEAEEILSPVLDALAAIAQQNPEVIDLLVAALKSPDPKMRAGAAATLGHVRRAGDKATKALIAAMADPAPTVRLRAVDAVKLSPDKSAVGPMLRLLRDPDPRVRREADAALPWLARECPDIAPELLEGAKNADVGVRLGAMYALRWIRDNPAVIECFLAAMKDPALTTALEDKDATVAVCAALSLAEFGNAAAPAVPRMIDRLRKGPDRRELAKAIGGMGPVAKAAVPVLLEFLDECGSDGAWALRGVGADPGEVLPFLIKRMSDPKPGTRASAAYAAGVFAEKSAPALPRLTELLSDPEDHVRYDAALSLRNIGPAASAALPALTKAVSDKSARVRGMAVDALRSVGTGSAETVAAIAAATRDPE